MILIVDDHIDGCDALVQFLKADGYDSTCVNGGMEALNWLSTEMPTVLVLDDFMPEMCGLDVIRELRKDARYAALPIVFYTAGEDAERRTIALSLGAVAWIPKGRVSWTEAAKTIESFARQDRAAMTSVA